MGRFTVARWLVGLACAVALSGMVCAGLVLAPLASAADMVYWGNYDGSTISFAKLDGSGAGDLLTTSGDPDGLAIDSATDKIYWVNHFTDKVFFANLDGSASGSLTTTGVTPEDPWGWRSIPPRKRSTGATKGMTRSPSRSSTAAAAAP